MILCGKTQFKYRRGRRQNRKPAFAGTRSERIDCFMRNLPGPQITKHGRVTLISLGRDYENLDEATLEQLQPQLFAAMEEADPPDVVLDLSKTKFFGSSFIEIIIRMVNRIESQRQGRFALAGLTKYCAEVLEITHLDSLWKIYPSADEAVAALSKEA